MEDTRVDKWLWAVRVFKTRALATAACRGGHVRVNGAPAKPAATVRVGDQVEVRSNGSSPFWMSSRATERNGWPFCSA